MHLLLYYPINSKLERGVTVTLNDHPLNPPQQRRSLSTKVLKELAIRQPLTSIQNWIFAELSTNHLLYDIARAASK